MRTLFLTLAVMAVTVDTAATAIPIGQTAPQLPAAPLPAPLPVAQQASEAAAMRFAQLYVPANVVKAGAQKAFRREFVKSFAAVPENVQLEQNYPGAQTAALESGAVMIGVLYDKAIPPMQGRIAALMRPHFTTAELGMVSDFIASDTGQLMQRSIADDAEGQNRLAAAGSSAEGFAINGEQLRASIGPGFLAKMSPAQIREVAAFGTSKVGMKFNRFSTLLTDLIAAETTALVQDGRVDMQTAIMQAVARHIATNSTSATKGSSNE